jgi:membrane peptidoglycan carboxypeptidase
VARPFSPTGALPRLGLALLISVLAGVLVAGLAAPVIGGIGLVAKASTDDFMALPTELDTPALATRSQVLAADGSVLANFYSQNRVEAPLASIPVSMRQAIVAIEDSRFYEHDGIDYKGTARAAVANAKSGGVTQGGSTLTQQYVKNALLQAAKDKAAQAAATTKSADRKLKEARYAVALEQKLPKDEILHRYLDIAYFGEGVYGIGTAATYFFNKPVEQLTLAQSALLAGVVQNPSKYNVASKDPEVLADLKNRRDTVLGRMRDVGYITEQVRAETAALPLEPVNPVKLGQDCGAAGVLAPFFCQYMRYELEETPVGAALGETKVERQNALFTGGLTIQTSIDPRIQRAAQTSVDSQVPNGDPSGVAAANNIVEPGTGLIRAMAVDRAYGEDASKGESQVNLATGGTQGVQPGSTFKIFWLASALQQGIPLSTKFVSPAKYTSTKNGCANAGEGGRPFTVSNAGDSEAGTFDMRSGTADSVNTYYAQLAERTGLAKPLALADALGVRQVSGGPLPDVCTSYLGSASVSPLAMAGAYAAFAAHGLYCPPRAIQGITGPDGKPVPVPENACKQVVEPGVADTVTSVLQGVITGGTGTGAALGRPAAGKTGTTNDSKAAWFAGYTPQLASTVWVGHVPAPADMTNIRINKRYYRQVYGGTLPAALWKQGMQLALAGQPVKGFQPADPRVAAGDGSTTSGSVPNVSGRSYSDAAAILSAAGFKPAAGRAVPSRVGAGRVAYTSPRAGRSAPPGATVYIYRSSGPAPAQPRTQAPPAPRAPSAPTDPPAAPPAPATTQPAAPATPVPPTRSRAPGIPATPTG